MKSILVLITVVVAFGLVAPSVAAGQQATRTKELPLTAEQLAEEIAAWKKQLAVLMEDLHDPSKIWIQVAPGAVYVEDEADLMDRIRKIFILDFKLESALNRELGFERAMWTEQKFIVEMDEAVKATYDELMARDRIIRADKERSAERMREIIGALERKRAEALASRSLAAGTPEFKPEEAAVTATEKEAVLINLDSTAKQENWDTRDTDYVKSYLGKTKTPFQLRLVKNLIKDFSVCYQAWNKKNAQIDAEASAGNWMPGQRIGAKDEALRDRNDRLQAAKASLEDLWQSP